MSTMTEDLSPQARAGRAVWMLMIHENLTVNELAEAVGLRRQSAQHLIDQISAGGVPIYEPRPGMVALQWDGVRPIRDDVEDEIMRGFVDVGTAADMLSVHPETIRRRIRKRELPAIRFKHDLYLIREDDL